MAATSSNSPFHINRRRFLQTSLSGVAGMALYSGEIARHRLEITRHEIQIAGLPAPLEGLRLAQISDIHMDEYTEPFFLRRVVRDINGLKPDAVLFTGDYISYVPLPRKFALSAIGQCAEILDGLECKRRYGVLGNHDCTVGAPQITKALNAHGIEVLNNRPVAFEQNGARLWLSGVLDPSLGLAQIEKAIPSAIQNRPEEPVVLLSHAPDYADMLHQHRAGQSVRLMLSGHTHGGQVCLPFLRPLILPFMGRKYIRGLFRIGAMQLYVNRGIGAVGIPFRLNSLPEISLFTLRRA